MSMENGAPKPRGARGPPRSKKGRSGRCNGAPGRSSPGPMVTGQAPSISMVKSRSCSWRAATAIRTAPPTRRLCVTGVSGRVRIAAPAARGTAVASARSRRSWDGDRDGARARGRGSRRRGRRPPDQGGRRRNRARAVRPRGSRRSGRPRSGSRCPASTPGRARAPGRSDRARTRRRRCTGGARVAGIAKLVRSRIRDRKPALRRRARRSGSASRSFARRGSREKIDANALARTAVVRSPSPSPSPWARRACRRRDRAQARAAGAEPAGLGRRRRQRPRPARRGQGSGIAAPAMSAHDQSLSSGMRGRPCTQRPISSQVNGAAASARSAQWRSAPCPAQRRAQLRGIGGGSGSVRGRSSADGASAPRAGPQRADVHARRVRVRRGHRQRDGAVVNVAVGAGASAGDFAPAATAGRADHREEPRRVSAGSRRPPSSPPPERGERHRDPHQRRRQPARPRRAGRDAAPAKERRRRGLGATLPATAVGRLVKSRASAAKTDPAHRVRGDRQRHARGHAGAGMAWVSTGTDWSGCAGDAVWKTTRVSASRPPSSSASAESKSKTKRGSMLSVQSFCLRSKSQRSPETPSNQRRLDVVVVSGGEVDVGPRARVRRVNRAQRRPVHDVRRIGRQRRIRRQRQDPLRRIERDGGRVRRARARAVDLLQRGRLVHVLRRRGVVRQQRRVGRDPRAPSAGAVSSRIRPPAPRRGLRARRRRARHDGRQDRPRDPRGPRGAHGVHSRSVQRPSISVESPSLSRSNSSRQQ